MLRVNVDGLNFIGAESMGHTGFIIGPKGWKGWESGTSASGERIKRPHADGDYDLPVYRSSRIIQLAGTAVAESLDELTHMGDIYNGLFDSGPVQLTVYMGDTMRWAMVDLDETQFEISGNSKRFNATFSLRMWAPDPLKFGASQTFAAGEEARHYGNTTAPVEHTVAGAMPEGYTIGGPAGRQYIVTAPLVAGIPHEIEMKSGDLFIGGVQSFAVDRADVWGIPRGLEGVTHSLTGAGTGTLATLVPDTYK